MYFRLATSASSTKYFSTTTPAQHANNTCANISQCKLTDLNVHEGVCWVVGVWWQQQP